MSNDQLTTLMALIGWLASYGVAFWLSYRYSRRFFGWLFDWISTSVFGGKFYRVMIKEADGSETGPVRVWGADPGDAVKKALKKTGGKHESPGA